MFLFIFRLCPRSGEYIKEYFKSPEFINHYQTTSKQLVTDLQTALDDHTFCKCMKFDFLFSSELYTFIQQFI